MDEGIKFIGNLLDVIAGDPKINEDSMVVRIEHPTFGGSDFWTIASVYVDINGVVNIVVGDQIEKAV